MPVTSQPWLAHQIASLPVPHPTSSIRPAGSFWISSTNGPGTSWLSHGVKPMRYMTWYGALMVAVSWMEPR
jgi:hypothetical protein